MSLRTRFVVLFTLLAVVPLVGIGAFGYVRALRAVETLIATQVKEIARSAARQVGERYGRHLLARGRHHPVLVATLTT